MTVKRLLSIMVIICLFLTVTSPAIAKKSGGFKSGGFSKPKTTTTDSAPAGSSKDSGGADSTQSTTGGTTKSATDAGTGDKIPYTNLPSSKMTSGADAAATIGKSNLSGFRPSFFPFSGNFWMWMFLMNSFGHSQPAVAQTEAGGQGTQETETGENQQGIYTPALGDYWAADPLANIISTAILVAVIALPIVMFLKWRKKRLSF